MLEKLSIASKIFKFLYAYTHDFPEVSKNLARYKSENSYVKLSK